MNHISINIPDLLPSMPINADSEFWCKGCGEELAEDWVFCECCERIFQIGTMAQSLNRDTPLNESVKKKFFICGETTTEWKWWNEKEDIVFCKRHSSDNHAPLPERNEAEKAIEIPGLVELPKVDGLDKQKEGEKVLKKLDEYLGVIRVNAKFILMSRKDGTLIVGGIFDKLLSSNKDEMWVAELTIRPVHKFTEHKDEGWKYLTIEQKLASGWGDKDNWRKKLMSDASSVEVEDDPSGRGGQIGSENSQRSKDPYGGVHRPAT